MYKIWYFTIATLPALHGTTGEKPDFVFPTLVVEHTPGWGGGGGGAGGGVGVGVVDTGE